MALKGGTWNSHRSFEGVDDSPRPPMGPFSDLRAVAKLLFAVLVGSAPGTIPLLLSQSGLQRAEREREEQERLQRDLINLEKAARQGPANEAARRLRGIRTRPETARQESSPGVAGSREPKASGRPKEGAPGVTRKTSLR
jgi:hypothetical protein